MLSRRRFLLGASLAGNRHAWSSADAANDVAGPDASWRPGQLPGSPNGAARATMDRVAALLDDSNGTLTTTGSANAYAVTSNVAYGALTTGIRLAIKASFTNTGPATLDLTPAGGSALGARAIKIVTMAG